MKKIILSCLAICSITSAFALESGAYTNHSHNAGDPTMYRSLELDTSVCKNGGAMVRFYSADPMSFCVGKTSNNVYKYKKCIGKVISAFPIKGCLGIEKQVEMITAIKVTRVNGTVVLSQTEIDDGKVYFEQSYTLSEISSHEVSVTQKFSDKRDGRTGSAQYIFTQTN